MRANAISHATTGIRVAADEDGLGVVNNRLVANRFETITGLAIDLNGDGVVNPNDANDADTGWQSVQVSPPPVLVPLDGRPSPQIHLDFPAYSDLLSIELPDGSGIIECVCGTSVTIRAATDRPVARAWIGDRPENATLKLLSSLSPLGANSEITSLGLQLLASEVWADVPVTLLRDGTLLEVRFIPRVPGPYALRFEDETGLGNTQHADVRSTRATGPCSDREPRTSFSFARIVARAPRCRDHVSSEGGG